MAKRSAEAWRELFEAQARSGLKASAFCREHGLCPKYFSRRKKVLSQGNAVAVPSPFVRIEPLVGSAREVMASHVRLRLGRCEWELTGLTVGDLARLMQALV